MKVPSLGSGGNHIVDRRARGGGNSSYRWEGILIVADHPLTNRLVEGSGNVGANLFLTGARIEIERRMPLPALTATVRLAARAVPQYQIAPQKRLVGQELSGAGACVSLLDRMLRSRNHSYLLCWHGN